MILATWYYFINLSIHFLSNPHFSLFRFPLRTIVFINLSIQLSILSTYNFIHTARRTFHFFAFHFALLLPHSSLLIHPLSLISSSIHHIIISSIYPLSLIPYPSTNRSPLRGSSVLYVLFSTNRSHLQRFYGISDFMEFVNSSFIQSALSTFSLSTSHYYIPQFINLSLIYIKVSSA